MSRRRAALPGLAVLAASLAATPSLRAQASEAQPATVLPPATVEVVRLEVMVHDKHGQPRAGLGREDFTVVEDGQSQPIVQFQEFVRRAGPGAPPAPGTAEQEVEDFMPARYVVLAIDDLHMEFASLSRLQKALYRFLEEDLRPEDQVALVSTSGASALSQEFTTDREALRRTLSRLSPHGRLPDWGTVPHISDYQAELIEAGDPQALNAAVQEILSDGTMQDAASAEGAATHRAHAVFAEAVHRSRQTLATLESLCRGLSGLSGRKALFLVSDGFLTGIGAGSGATFDLRRIADAGTRAGVVVYVLDSGGLVASPLVMRASSPLRMAPNSVGTIAAINQRSEQALREAMHALAADTGGFLVENSNDLRRGLRAILRDTEAYYVLAYEPTNRKRDGAFRRIEVRLPRGEGLRVRTRSGYFAPDDRRLVAAADTAEAEARREEQRRAEMSTALESLAPLTAIPVRLSADFVSLDPGVTRLVVSGSVDVSALPFVRRHDRRQATVDAVAVVYDESGAVAATLQTERSAMDLSDAEYQQLLGRGLPYEKTAALNPGRYQVRLAAREDATGLLGSAWQWIEVPDMGAGRLALSSLFLLKDAGPATTPATDDTLPPLRSVQAVRSFGRDENLYVQLYAYNPRRDSSGAIHLSSQAQVLKGGVLLGTAAPEPMVEGETRGPVAHTSRIKLHRFEPGEYELRVTVTDARAAALAARSVRFSVE